MGKDNISISFEKLDFNFDIDGTFFVWLKFNLASYSVGGFSFFWPPLINVVLMTLSFTTSLLPVAPHFLRTFVQDFSYGTSVSWLREYSQFPEAMPLRGYNSHFSLRGTNMLLCTSHLCSYITEFKHFVILSSYLLCIELWHKNTTG